MKNSNTSTQTIAMVGMFTAVLAVLSILQIPMPSGVPITLQTFAVALCGFSLGRRRGTLCVLLYLILYRHDRRHRQTVRLHRRFPVWILIPGILLRHGWRNEKPCDRRHSRSGRTYDLSCAGSFSLFHHRTDGLYPLIFTGIRTLSAERYPFRSGGAGSIHHSEENPGKRRHLPHFPYCIRAHTCIQLCERKPEHLTCSGFFIVLL